MNRLTFHGLSIFVLLLFPIIIIKSLRQVHSKYLHLSKLFPFFLSQRKQLVIWWHYKWILAVTFSWVTFELVAHYHNNNNKYIILHFAWGIGGRKEVLSLSWWGDAVFLGWGGEGVRTAVAAPDIVSVGELLRCHNNRVGVAPTCNNPMRNGCFASC